MTFPLRVNGIQCISQAMDRIDAIVLSSEKAVDKIASNRDLNFSDICDKKCNSFFYKKYLIGPVAKNSQ